MITELNLSGIIGKKAATHNGEDWNPYQYEIIGYSLSTNPQTGSQQINLYLLKESGNGLPVIMTFNDIKIKTDKE